MKKHLVPEMVISIVSFACITAISIVSVIRISFVVRTFMKKQGR